MAGALASFAILTRDNWQIGISSVWYEGNPCNMHLLDLGGKVKEGVTVSAARCASSPAFLSRPSSPPTPVLLWTDQMITPLTFAVCCNFPRKRAWSGTASTPSECPTASPWAQTACPTLFRHDPCLFPSFSFSSVPMFPSSSLSCPTFFPLLSCFSYTCISRFLRSVLSSYSCALLPADVTTPLPPFSPSFPLLHLPRPPISSPFPSLWQSRDIIADSIETVMGGYHIPYQRPHPTLFSCTLDISISCIILRCLPAL